MKNIRPKSAHLILSLACLFLLSSQLMAVSFNEEEPWNYKPGGADAAVGGWYINLGITGARAKFHPADLKTLIITYVFPKSPAEGKLQVGDRIVGVNNTPFSAPISKLEGRSPIRVTFDPKKPKELVDSAIGGPLADFGNALEKSQSILNGKLTVTVLRGEAKSEVEMNIGTRYGAYDGGFPNGRCHKTDLILSELLAYLAKNKDSWMGDTEVGWAATLALLASEDKKYLSIVKESVQRTAKHTHRKITKEEMGGLSVWHNTFAGIVLAEYFLATKEPWVLPELEEVRDWLLEAQFMDNAGIQSMSPDLKRETILKYAVGGWGHNPGHEYYGPMAVTTGQAAMALSLMVRCGISVDRARIEKALDCLAVCTAPNGNVGYGPGYGQNTDTSDWYDMGRNGAACLANYLCTYPDEKYQKRALLISDFLGKHNAFWADTHASPLIGMAWQAAAAQVQPEGFTKLMNDFKWWLNLAHNTDGTFYNQPNREVNWRDNLRVNMSAIMALVFSLHKKNLLISGAAGAAGQNRDFQVPAMALSVKDVTAKTKPVYGYLMGNNFSRAQTYITQFKAEMEKRLDNPLYKKEETEKELGLLKYFQEHIDGIMSSFKDQVSYLDSVGDVYKLQKLLNEYRTAMGGIAAFDEMSARHFESFKTPEVKKEIDAGKAFYLALEQSRPAKNAPSPQRTPTPTPTPTKAMEDLTLPLKKFIEKNSGSNYGPVAQAIVEELTQYPLTVIQPKSFFKVKKPGEATTTETANGGAPAVAETPQSSARMALSPEALAEWQTRFVKKLDALAKGGAKLKVDLGDKRDYVLRGANETALLVNTHGNDLPMPWRLLTPGNRAALAKGAATADDVEALLVAAVMHLACDQKEQAEGLFAQAALKDPNAVKAARAALSK